jgi:hypothetical protein
MHVLLDIPYFPASQRRQDDIPAAPSPIVYLPEGQMVQLVDWASE